MPVRLPIRFPLASFALLLCLLLGASPVAAQNRAVPIADYWRLLDDSQAALAALNGAGVTAVRAELDRLAGRWDVIDAVRLADGSTVAVDHGALVAAMRATPPDVEGVAARLEALQALRADWPDAVYTAADAEVALASLEGILARPAFQWPADEPTLWERLRERILRFLFNLLPDEIAAGRPIAILLTVAGAAVLLAVLAFALRSFLADFTAEAEGGAEGADGERLTADSALQRAQELSRGGDYRTAVRYLYLSSLLLLDEHGLLRYDRARTNREYLRSVAHRPELARILRHVVDVFDRVWYGFQPLDAATYAEYEAQVNALKKQR